MNPIKIKNTTVLLFFIFLFSTQNIKAQEIDTDSLLSVILQDMKNNPPNYQRNIQKALLGKKLAPDYLDFHLLLGRNYELSKNKDSACYYYKYVIQKNPRYEEAYLFLINLNLKDKKYEEAETLINQAIKINPDNKEFRLKRIAIYSLLKDTENEAKYLKLIKKKFPNDPEIQRLLNNMYSELKSDKIGIYYNVTSIDREGVGPWHLGSINYIRQRHWGSLIGRISYANRYANNVSAISGLQYEVESYINHYTKSYSYLDAAYSPDLAFPKLRLAYSYFYNFKNGWEADLGLRYLKTVDSDLGAINVGVGKYIGSIWLNFRTYFQKDNPAFLFNSRYYLKSKDNYLSLFGGYGTSPDDEATIGQYEQRATLQSYRIGVGYSKTLLKHYIINLLTSYNNQEYAPDLIQNEFEIGFSLQYKF